MRKILIIIVVAAQLGVLGFMAGEREWVLRTGRSVYLRTAPIDPRDPMRGDYIRLTYEIATVPKRLCRDGVRTWFDAKEAIYDSNVRDRRVYAAVRLDQDGVAELVSLSDQPPSEGIYLRGRANAIYLSTIDVRFGVEALFMQQGKAREFENTMRTTKAGVPLNVEVAVNSHGLAVIKGHRWEPLGITLTLDRSPPASSLGPRTPRPGLRGVTIELKNHSDASVAIVDSPGTHGLRLVPRRAVSRMEEPTGWVWVHDAAPPTKPEAGDIKVLKPGESHRVHLDFTSPEWFVRKYGEKNQLGAPTSLETLTENWNATFRIEYAPPSAEECTGLPDADVIRHARLRSRMFSAAGGAD